MNGLILMTRIPIPGQTKTRLMNVLTGEECAQLHRCFLMDLFNVFEYLRGEVDIFLAYTPAGDLHLIEDMLPDYIKAFPQEGEDLGERMANAIEHVLNEGYEKAVLIGSDIPTIEPEDIKEAFKLLDDNHIALGPTHDGGYYLVGMKRLYKDVFDGNLKWGKKSVFEGTLHIANNLGLRVGLVPKRMDIDTAEDISILMDKVEKNQLSRMPKNTVDYLKGIWGEIDAKRQFKSTN